MPHECTNCGRTFPDGSKEMLSGCPDCGGNKFQFAPTARAATGSSESASATASGSASDPGPDAGDAAGSSEATGTVERAAETVRDWVSSDASGADESPPAGANAPTVEEAQPGPDRDRDRDRDGGNRSWPSSDDPADGDAASDAGDEFEEWPETARRPEDRSTPPTDDTAPASSADAASDAVDSPPTAAPESTGERSIVADSENTAQADARSEVVSTDDLPDGSAGRDHGAASADDARASGPADGEDSPPSDGRVVSEPSGEQPSIEELREELNEQFESIKIVSPGQYELNLMELYNREEYIISLQEDGRYVIDVPDSWRSDEE